MLFDPESCFSSIGGGDRILCRTAGNNARDSGWREYNDSCDHPALTFHQSPAPNATSRRAGPSRDDSEKPAKDAKAAQGQGRDPSSPAESRPAEGTRNLESSKIFALCLVRARAVDRKAAPPPLHCESTCCESRAGPSGCVLPTWTWGGTWTHKFIELVALDRGLAPCSLQIGPGSKIRASSYPSNPIIAVAVLSLQYM